jgi:DNA-binding HxlR family transcriptional regulator
MWCKTLIIMTKKNQIKARRDYECLEQVVGCKWSVSVLMAVEEGTDRPGTLERAITGISTKILSERLRKLTAYGLLHKKKFNETPPRTVYSLTPKGRQLVHIIGQLRELDNGK